MPRKQHFSKRSSGTGQEAKPVKKDGAHGAQPSRGASFIWGFHAVSEAWLNPRRRCLWLLLTAEAHDKFADILKKAEERGIERPAPLLADRAAISALLPAESVHQGMALETAQLHETGLDEIIAPESGADVVVVLDQVTDPHNVGAVLRSCAAFGAGAVIITADNAPATTGTLAKSASGALEHVPLVRVTNLARALVALAKSGYWRIGLDEQGERSIDAPDMAGRVAIVLGAEGSGLRRLTRENCDEIVRLPTMGPVGSLNVSNAAAVALYEARRQINMKSRDAGKPKRG